MLNDQNLSRGYRNNNPLNIDYYNMYGKMANDWKGQIGVEPLTDKIERQRFAQFQTMEYGYRAALILLRNYIKNYNLHTIGAIINRWAPAEDSNDPVSYANRVCNIINNTWAANITPATVVSRNDRTLLCRIAYGMSVVENDSAKYKEYNHAQGLPDINIINTAWGMI